MMLNRKWIKKLEKTLCNGEIKSFSSSMANWFPIFLKNILLGSFSYLVEAHNKYTKTQHEGNLFPNSISSMHRLKCHRDKGTWIEKVLCTYTQEKNDAF